MKNKLKQIALIMVSAVLLAIALTGCGGSGGGGGGNTPSKPSVPSTPTNVISTASVTQGQPDEEGNITLVKTYDVTAADVEAEQCVVVQEEITWNELGVSRVVSTAAVWRDALESENELVNALASVVFKDTDDIVFIRFDYCYDSAGTVETVTVQCEDFIVTFENVDGVLQATGDLEGIADTLEIALNKLANSSEVIVAVQWMAEETYSNAEEIVIKNGFTVQIDYIVANDDSWVLVAKQDSEGNKMVAKSFTTDVETILAGRKYAVQMDIVAIQPDGSYQIVRTYIGMNEGDDFDLIYNCDAAGNLESVMIAGQEGNAIYGIEDGALGQSYIMGDMSATWEFLFGTSAPSKASISSFVLSNGAEAKATANQMVKMAEDYGLL